MNMNGIVNMIIRIIMRKMINSGINTGMKAVNGKGRKKPRHNAENTGYIEPQEQQPQHASHDRKPTQAQIRRRRAARKAARQAKKQ